METKEIREIVAMLIKDAIENNTSFNSLLADLDLTRKELIEVSLEIQRQIENLKGKKQ